MLKTVSTWPALRWPWALLTGSALLLEICALYFQYAMGLEPCVMCIYQRTAVIGILLGGLPALLKPDNVIARGISLLVTLVSSLWGLQIAYTHVQMQNPENFMLLLSCDVIPNFPTWLPLHTMLPAIFEARGTCGDIDWAFLGLSMPYWMMIIFAGYSVVLIAVMLSRLLLQRKI